MNGSMIKIRMVMACLGASLAFSAQAQQSLEWMKEMPGQNQGGGPITTIVPESNAPQARPADPKYRAKIHTELAAAYFEAGNMAVALDEIRVALENDSSYVQAYSVRGLIHAQLKENAKAEEDFRKALSLAPNNPEVNNNYGWYLCQSGQPRQSIQYFLNALKDPLYDTPDVAYFNAGTCAVKAGDFDGAQGYLLNSLRLARGPAPGTRYQLANLFYQRGNLDEAKIYLNEAIKAMDTPSAEALWLGVRLERKLGNKAGEGSYASQLRSRYPTSLEYQAFLKGNFE
ncbi:type IV pilus biogenesis/stability protein PilW [Dechloromonas sp. H13]|uniref:type IV pilus biogenesis/stability protein PilW n=1 Tax=Dechloromonas sp. H13 TaxID=2570193 RepID=UPI001D18B556|nr:type IV pilus biogenesis/stability protein PilW [Dechloromonas sp. H13]